MTRKAITGAALAALVFSSCSSSKSSSGPCPAGASLKGNAPPEGTLTWCASNDGTKHGPWTEYYKGGTLKRKGDYKDGKMEGRWVTYHEPAAPATEADPKEGHTADDGHGHESEARPDPADRKPAPADPPVQADKKPAPVDAPVKKQEGDYKGGLKDGVWTSWHEDGAKKRESVHEAGSAVVKWTAWAPEGPKWAAGTTVGGKEHGPYTEWHPNGKVSTKGTYENGERVGEWQWWDADGNPTADPDADPANAPPPPSP